MSLSLALVLAGAGHALLLCAHGTYIALVHGVRWGMGRRSVAAEGRDLDRRFERSIANNMESLVAFVPIAAASLAVGVEAPLVALIYVGARVGFVSVYLANIPVVRTLFWLVGQGAVLWLAVRAVAGFAG